MQLPRHASAHGQTHPLEAEIGMTRDGSVLIWPATGQAPVAAPTVSVALPRITVDQHATPVEYHIPRIAVMTYAELRTLAAHIAKNGSSRDRWIAAGRSLLNPYLETIDADSLLTRLVVTSGILDIAVSSARRRAAQRQLDTLRAMGTPLETFDYDHACIQRLWHNDPGIDTETDLGWRLRELGWVQSDGQILGVARCWALGGLETHDASARLRRVLDDADEQARRTGLSEGVVSTLVVRRFLDSWMER